MEYYEEDDDGEEAIEQMDLALSTSYRTLRALDYGDDARQPIADFRADIASLKSRIRDGGTFTPNLRKEYKELGVEAYNR
jgi:hypothetical protein